MSLIHLLVALRCEAQPLIARYGLQPLARESGQRRIYAGGDLRLIVAGVGREAAVAATHELASRCGSAAHWVDLGVAGHRWRPVGEVLLASVVHEEASGRVFSLEQRFVAPCPQIELETHDDVVEDYPQADRAVEMEASGFVAAALPLAPAGAIHCLKVISDNATSPIATLAAARISELIAAALPTLELLLALLRHSGKEGS